MTAVLSNPVSARSDQVASTYGDLAVLPAAQPEADIVRTFLAAPALSPAERTAVSALAVSLIDAARGARAFGVLEKLMAAFSLSRDEGRALMELAEAFLRIPDAATRDALIADKLAGRDWRAPEAPVSVRAAAAAFRMAGAVVSPGSGGVPAVLRRLGRPAVRAAVEHAMRLMGRQFVLAPTIGLALAAARRTPDIRFSFDMLGEGARTRADADRHYHAYLQAVETVGSRARSGNPHGNDGVSVKLSALSCRYRTAAWPDLCRDLLPVLRHLALRARAGNVPLTIDAEEAARLEVSLGLVRALAEDPVLAGWNGLGVVVQAYNLRAGAVIDWLADLAARTGQRIAVRLVKGAYWDAEIKAAQEKGLASFPVYTRKAHTDLAYLAHARRLLTLADRLYPQFAGHNAHTMAAVEIMARGLGVADFEVQRLHGMGAAAHRAFRARCGRRERIYAPVGGHRDLLAYLVRRLLENGANASFLHQLGDPAIPAQDLARDPYDLAAAPSRAPALRTGVDMFQPKRRNSRGWDLDDPATLAATADIGGPLPPPPGPATTVDADAAWFRAEHAAPAWAARSAEARAAVLDDVADGLEQDAPALLSLLAREAGKTLPDAVADLREAVDFCRYYAAAARALPAGCRPRGVVLAISPWNFPLAIFIGQVAAALGAGNAVIAKPAEQTPRIADHAVRIMHRMGVPEDALQFLNGPGQTLGAYLTSAGRADMVVFTGSTETARAIHRAVASSAKPAAPLLAETGGLNAMIVDSTALLERAADDIVASAFRSAGQRCSSLRMLYVQEDNFEPLVGVIRGAAEALRIGDSGDPAVDMGPVIDADAKAAIDTHVAAARAVGRLVWQGAAPEGLFCAPAIIRVSGIADLAREVFGPVLHIAPYPAGGEADVIAGVNGKGYGLTFGVQTRIRSRALACAEAAQAGNVYVNRNQIGAVVGSQPFGGHGLSGTGPKAGGPLYLGAFTLDAPPPDGGADICPMPGPDGEENLYRRRPRGRVLCLGGADPAPARAAGNEVVTAAELPGDVMGIAAVMADPEAGVDLGALRRRLADAPGPLIPLITDAGGQAWLHTETHRCTDLTASGGNAALLSRSGD
ncbi:MAG: L-glutamate gamma-semialdehyde dehydrogenase [Rhodospirillales bacterium]